MGHGHAHAAETASWRHRRPLTIVLVITVVTLVVELVGASVSGSVALLADAGHLLVDCTGIGLALLASHLARLPATARRTFGWHRAEILAGAVNALLLLGVAGFVLVEALHRLMTPQPVEGPVMLGVAALGLVANAVSLALLRRGQRESLNVRGAYLEVLGDLAGSVGVLVAALVVATTGMSQADPIASLLIVLFVLPRAWALLREVTHVLLEGAPHGVDLGHVRAHILSVPGVLDIHDLHVWTITSGQHVVSAHVVVEDTSLSGHCGGGVLDRLGDCLAHHFDVEHSTFQLEPAGHRDHEAELH